MKKKKLWQLLSEEGYHGDAETFRAAVVDEFNESIDSVHGWTGDELLVHPDHAMAYCNRVRDRIDYQGLSYPLILRTLLNMRKRGGGDISHTLQAADA